MEGLADATRRKYSILERSSSPVASKCPQQRETILPELSVDGVHIHYEEYGAGQPILLFNELAADLCGWEAQVRHFARSYRVITFNYRGYPPSSVPAEVSAYAHEILVADTRALLGRIDGGKAYLVGHGTGGNLALSLSLSAPERIKGLVLAGSGAGSGNFDWKKNSLSLSEKIRTEGIVALSQSVASAPQRQPFAEKDPLGWRDFIRKIDAFDADGLANLVACGIALRPTFLDLAPEIAGLRIPVLVVLGDRDYPAFEPSLLVARTAPYAGLSVIPYCGHSIVMEEAAEFNRIVGDFLARVDQGRWAGWRPQ